MRNVVYNLQQGNKKANFERKEEPNVSETLWNLKVLSHFWHFLFFLQKVILELNGFCPADKQGYSCVQRAASKWWIRREINEAGGFAGVLEAYLGSGARQITGEIGVWLFA